MPDTRSQDELDQIGYELDEIAAALGCGYPLSAGALDRIDRAIDKQYEDLIRVNGSSLYGRITELNNASAEMRKQIRFGRALGVATFTNSS